MAICEFCNQEMSGIVESCTVNKVEFSEGHETDAIPYPADSEIPCHDCNVQPGGFHHPGCDVERCPECGGQIISCGCLSDDEEDDWDDDDDDWDDDDWDDNDWE